METLSTTLHDNPECYISELIFNNGQILNVNENDIVVFVGPNNSGKSQSLRDIYEISFDKRPAIVISDIKIVKNQFNEENFLARISKVKNEGHTRNYSGLNYSFSNHSITGFYNQRYYGSLRDVFICYLNTVNRLSITTPPQVIPRDSQKSHPIHFVSSHSSYRKWLSENYKKAFGSDLIPHSHFGTSVPLCIGTPVKLLQDFDNEQDRQEEYAKVLDTYKQVQNQGDGIKSFTGVLLNLMIDYYLTYLIDEPESFLHPPQANVLGRIIGESLTNKQQAFLSTHSEEIIKGLMSVCPERIKIVRITRENDTNSFSILENERFNSIWNDPLLKYSNIMSSLFHENVVLCESDSDCKMYSIIESYLRSTAGQYSETLFIHSGGKQRMAKIATALRSLNIEVKLIPDIDVLNDEVVFRGITDAFGIDWAMISSDYNILASNLRSSKKRIAKNSFRNNLDKILASSEDKNLNKKEVEAINDLLRTESKWNAIKKSGISAIPRGDAFSAFSRINQTLKNHNVFLVPVGELECFIKEISGHGPEWTNRVLETYPDLDNPIYEDIKVFISSMI